MKSGKVKFEYFQVRTANDGEVCEECKKHHMRIYPIILMDGLVPNHECTSEGGCRCYYYPTTRSSFDKQQEETRTGGTVAELKEKIAQAESLLRAGQKVQARNLLVEVVKADAQNVQAWYLLSFAADDTAQALYCIRQAAKVAP